MKYKREFAFTLAEVLITLAILGVVATIIIPNAFRRIQDRQTVTAVKRAYSMIDNALQQMYVIEGRPAEWGYNGQDTPAARAEFFMNKLSQYLPVQKYCSNNGGCLNYQCKYLSNNNAYSLEAWSWGGMVLKNGMRLSAFNFGGSGFLLTGNRIGNILIDINGQKMPNRIGYDIFLFGISDTGLLRLKNPDVWYSWWDGQIFNPANCNMSSNGYSCAYWIMKHNNMDYKYRDVSSEW